MQLTQIFVHPLKSGRGRSFSRAFAGFTGFLHDREWLVVSESGKFLTARTHPMLVRVQAELIPGAVLFSYSDKPAIMALAGMFDTPEGTQVWDDEFVAYHGDPRLDAWFSDILDTPCRLLWLGQKPTRKQKTSDQALSFADGYPYLLASETSLAELNGLLAQPVAMRNFRPNLVIDGAGAYEEDEWKRIRIGKIDFELPKLCSRCVLTTVDPETGVKDAAGEPLKTLIRTRQLPQGICFGVNMVALSEGMIALGDPVEVLETHYEF
jgi:uncharacterized protein